MNIKVYMKYIASIIDVFNHFYNYNNRYGQGEVYHNLTLYFLREKYKVNNFIFCSKIGHYKSSMNRKTAKSLCMLKRFKGWKGKR